MGFFKDCVLCFILGYTGEYTRILNEIENENNVKAIIAAQPTKPITPHYILQQVESLTDQIETNNAILYAYDNRLLTMYDNNKILELEKKRHKLAYDTARLEEKRIKLINKYNLEE